VKAMHREKRIFLAKLQDALPQACAETAPVAVADLEEVPLQPSPRTKRGVSQFVQMSPRQQSPAPGGSLETATKWVPVVSDATATHC
jgi:hypothetical protein